MTTTMLPFELISNGAHENIVGSEHSGFPPFSPAMATFDFLSTTLGSIARHLPQNRMKVLFKSLADPVHHDYPIAYRDLVEILGLAEALICCEAECVKYDNEWQMIAVWAAKRTCISIPSGMVLYSDINAWKLSEEAISAYGYSPVPGSAGDYEGWEEDAGVAARVAINKAKAAWDLSAKYAEKTNECAFGGQL